MKPLLHEPSPASPHAPQPHSDPNPPSLTSLSGRPLLVVAWARSPRLSGELHVVNSGELTPASIKPSRLNAAAAIELIGSDLASRASTASRPGLPGHRGHRWGESGAGELASSASHNALPDLAVNPQGQNHPPHPLSTSNPPFAHPTADPSIHPSPTSPASRRRLFYSYPPSMVAAEDWSRWRIGVASVDWLQSKMEIRRHAQQYFLKVQRNGIGEHLPPPRPKRKATDPYPHKA